jgi:hypothetical protein
MQARTSASYSSGYFWRSGNSDFIIGRVSGWRSFSGNLIMGGRKKGAGALPELSIAARAKPF